VTHDTPPIRVLVVDDDARFLAAAAQAIAAADDLLLADTATTLATGLALLTGPPADILVADLGLPDGSGVDLIAAARAAWPACEVMVATVFGDEPHVIAAIEAGATGYVLKDSRADALINEIRSLHAGGSPISPIIARRLLARLAVSAHNPARDAPSLLSKREEAVLDLISKGYSQGDVAAQLDVSQHTVRTFVRRTYLKLGVRTKAEAIQAARQLGIA
jgi:DNA-binding NarL/FixJ family response regulator